MSETVQVTPVRTVPGATVATASTTGPSEGAPSVLITPNGNTTIADGVVAKIAGIATREVRGVHELGGASSRAFGAVRERLGSSGQSMTQGVSVEVGERQAAVDLDIVVEYGMGIADVANGVRRNVISTIERMTGLQVTEVNINVNNIWLPGEDSEDTAPEPGQQPRVQ